MKTETLMKYKGFFAQIMEAERLVGDQTFGLPPGSALPAYCSNIFKEYPQNWMRGPGVFVIPVRPNKGLWFDFTPNDHANTAVLPTVKGCNPITGLQTSGYHLERYDTKCPKHNKEFGPDRFCEECGYKWPFGNYVARPNVLWLDGFRDSGDGTVRQFFFTEDEVRDIATKMIGKENTVPAFGFAFYRPKVERPREQRTMRGDSFLYKTLVPDAYLDVKGANTSWTLSNSSGSMTYSVPGANKVCFCNTSYLVGSLGEKSMPSAAGMTSEFDDMNFVDKEHTASAAPYKSPPKDRVLRKKAVQARLGEDYQPKKEVAIGAGAKIAQDLIEDPYPLDTWKDTPDSVMTIYFVFKDEVDRMLSKGVVDTTEKPEGMLEGMPVG